jgi:hypothetical protein
MEIHVNGTWIKMGMNRLEMFSDGVAIIITTMVLELKAPPGDTVAVRCVTRCAVALDIRPGGVNTSSSLARSRLATPFFSPSSNSVCQVIQESPRESSALDGGQAKLLDADLLATAAHDGTFDDGGELADVARPPVTFQLVLGVARQPSDFTLTLGQPRREVSCERQNVVGSFA